MEAQGYHFFKEIAIDSDSYVVPIVAASLTFHDNGLGNDTITRAAGDFTADGFAAGQSIVVGSSRNARRLELLVAAALTLTVPPGSFENEGPVGATVLGASGLWTFLSIGLQIRNRGTDALFYSFDGVNDHGRVPASSVIQLPHCLVTDLWLRRDSGAGSNDVEINAWG